MNCLYLSDINETKQYNHNKFYEIAMLFHHLLIEGGSLPQLAEKLELRQTF